MGVVLMTCLSACGGEGDTSSSSSSSPPPPPPTLAHSSAEGLWVGTTGTGRTVSGVVLDDATYWFLYSVAGDPSMIEGFIQGDSSFQNGTFTSSNAKDFNVGRSGAPVLDATRGGSGSLDSFCQFISGAWRMADYAAVRRVVRLSKYTPSGVWPSSA